MSREVGQVRRFGAVNWLGLKTLAWRETRTGLKDYNYQILGPVVSSLLYLAVFHLTISTVGAAGADAGLLDFIAPGLIIFVVCEKAFETACGSFISDKHERVIVDLLMAPLSSSERVCGYLGGASAAGIVVGAAVALVTLTFADLTVQKPWALVFFLLMGTMLHGLIGILVGIWAEKWDSYSAVHTFLLLPLFFLSGVFYRIDRLPELAQNLVRLNPVFYVIDGFRFGMTGVASSNPTHGVVVLLGVNAALFLVAYVWFRQGFRLKP